MTSCEQIEGKARVISEYVGTRVRRELVAEHLLPQPRDRRQLGEEAVTAEVEAIPVPLDGAGDAAHRVAGLEDGAGRAAPREHVAGGEPRGAAAEHDDGLGGAAAFTGEAFSGEVESHMAGILPARP